MSWFHSPPPCLRASLPLNCESLLHFICPVCHSVKVVSVRTVDYTVLKVSISQWTVVMDRRVDGLFQKPGGERRQVERGPVGGFQQEQVQGGSVQKKWVHWCEKEKQLTAEFNMYLIWLRWTLTSDVPSDTGLQTTPRIMVAVFFRSTALKLDLNHMTGDVWTVLVEWAGLWSTSGLQLSLKCMK